MGKRMKEEAKFKNCVNIKKSIHLFIKKSKEEKKINYNT